MRVKKHVLSSDLAGFTVDDMARVFLEVYDLYSNTMSIHTSLVQYKAHEIDTDELMDSVEACSEFSVSNLNIFKVSHGSAKYLVNKYVHRMCDKLQDFTEVLQKYTALSFAISEEELDDIIGKAYDVTSGCLFFLMIEFDMIDSIKDTKNFICDDIDEVIITACKMRYLDVRTVMGNVIYTYNKYRTHFEVFDLYPESETPFMEIMGDYTCLVDDARLTDEIVSGLLNGSVSPKQVLSLTSDLSEDEIEEIGEL